MPCSHAALVPVHIRDLCCTPATVVMTTGLEKMATFIGLMSSQRDIVDELFLKAREAEAERSEEFSAAIKIQSWFRGTRVRAYIKFLHCCATIIQRHFRGHKGREIYRQRVRQQVAEMRMEYYNNQATTIQKVWRGYYVRKYIHNFYSRKRYLEGLVAKNEIVRNELENLAVQSARIRAKEKQEKDKKSMEMKARKTHYLISTHQIPGVYSSPFAVRPSAKELELRSVRLQHNNRKKSPSRVKPDVVDILDLSGSTEVLIRDSKYKPLPPIESKMQGPFRTPDEVWDQRHKPLNPTLRVATSYTSADDARSDMKAQEWVTRLIDDKFVPFTHRKVPYDPLLHTSSMYGRLPYGTKHFREEDKEHHVSNKRFETVVSPIPLFDQFGKTYVS